MTASLKLVKLAAVRELGYPMGVTAPCWFTCLCGERWLAFEGDHVCGCGVVYDCAGWVL